MKTNYKSDFELRYALTDASGEPLPIPSNPWELWLSVGNPFEGRRKFVAKWDGNNYDNCKVVDGKIVVYAAKHGLPCGSLWVTFVDIQPSSDFPCGEKTIYTPQASDIELVVGAGDEPTQAEIEMVRTYVKVEYDDTVIQARLATVEGEVNAMTTPILNISAYGCGDNQGTKSAVEHGKNKINNISYNYSPFDDLILQVDSDGFNPETDSAVILRFGTRRTRNGGKIDGFVKKSKRGWTELKYNERIPKIARTLITPVYKAAGKYWVKAYVDYYDETPSSLSLFILHNLTTIGYDDNTDKTWLKLSHLGRTKKAEVAAESANASVTARYGVAIYRSVIEGGKTVSKRVSNIAEFNVIITVDFDEDVWIRFR